MGIDGINPEDLEKRLKEVEKAAIWIFGCAALIFCVCVASICGILAGPKIAVLSGLAALALVSMLYAMQVDNQKNFGDIR